MEYRIARTPDELTVSAPMPPGRRFFFFLAGLLPLLAPYELLLRPRWENIWNGFFLLAFGISAGAVAVSAFCMFAAVAGLSTKMEFDKRRKVLVFTAEGLLVPSRKEEVPFSALAAVDVETHEWTDGSPSYSLRVSPRDGRTIGLGSVWSKAEAEAARDEVAAFLGNSPAEPRPQASLSKK